VGAVAFSDRNTVEECQRHLQPSADERCEMAVEEERAARMGGGEGSSADKPARHPMRTGLYALAHAVPGGLGLRVTTASAIQ
jgi:hypothetical protein